MVNDEEIRQGFGCSKTMKEGVFEDEFNDIIIRYKRRKEIVEK